MRALLVGLALLSISTSAFAQGGMGGMGGGGMGGGDGPMGRGGAGGLPGGGAGGPGGPGGGRPKEMKPIKREKFDKAVQAMFAAADTDRNAVVTLEELRAVLEAKRDKVIRERFSTIDSNGNGTIEWAEFQAWQKPRGSAVMSDAAMRGVTVGPVAESLPPPMGDSDTDRMLEMLVEPLSATVLVNANSNYDQGVSLAELLAYEGKRFTNADKDGDGALSAEEIRRLMPEPKNMGGRGGQGAGGPPPPDGVQ